MYGRGERKLEIIIPPQQIYENSNGGIIIKGGVMSSEYSTGKPYHSFVFDIVTHPAHS